MKKMKQIIAVILAVMLMASLVVIPAAAKDIDDYQKSVVYIEASATYTASNYNLQIPCSWSGTGFAVGTPGKPIQYIATNAHVVDEPSGVYAVYIDANGDLMDWPEAQEEGTAYPKIWETKIGGVPCLKVVDYFKTETTELNAVFSSSSNDMIKLTTVAFDHNLDVALCKLAGEPITKIQALPLQLKEDVKVNTHILSIGYPYTSDYVNAEQRNDYADSAVKNGIISKMVRTTGLNDSKVTYEFYEITADVISGMSGGPVINEETGAVVAMNSFGLTISNSTNYVIPVDFLLEMMDRENIKYEIWKPVNFLPWILLGVGILLVLGIVLLIVIILLVKRKKKPAPAQQAPVNRPPMNQPPMQQAPMNQPPMNQPPMQQAPMNQPPMQQAPTAPAPGMPMKKYYIIGEEGPMNGRKFAITDVATIGRDPSRCNVVFPANQPGVSGLHCEVRLNGDVLLLKDCGSSYGTYLDGGVRIESGKPVVLAAGSKFYLGSDQVSFMVRY
ncbi:MAG: trypsin-like peptidase domain-containing protein [Clostridia bacterium]|nr:trypsin-like peptidase domain-containing protein [Clostridia bacterium]